MTRRLPWKTSQASLPEKCIPSPGPVRQSPAKSSTPTPLAKKRRCERVPEPERIRSPSTSPPPEPPRESFIIPGPEADDRYRMVEDEFLAVANKFTAHLHRAAYERLKNQAKRQNAATIEEIARPVVGPPTLAAKRRHEIVKRAVKQRKLLKDAAEDASNVASTTTGLRGLMGSPKKEVKRISAPNPHALKTRASAGFTSSWSQQSGELTAPRPSSRPLVRQDRTERTIQGRSPSAAVTSTPRQTSSKTHPSSPFLSSRTPTSVSRSAASRSAVVKPPDGSSIEDEDDDDDDDDDDPFGLNKRRIQRHKSRELHRNTEPRQSPSEPPKQKRSQDIIPSFL